jgi:hypothetical protein
MAIVLKAPRKARAGEQSGIGGMRRRQGSFRWGRNALSWKVPGQLPVPSRGHFAWRPCDDVQDNIAQRRRCMPGEEGLAAPSQSPRGAPSGRCCVATRAFLSQNEGGVKKTIDLPSCLVRNGDSFIEMGSAQRTWQRQTIDNYRRYRLGLHSPPTSRQQRALARRQKKSGRGVQFH